MRADGYRWWIERFRRTFELVDLTRVDHFRGFVSYWAVPARNTTAVEGVWRRGPGASLFRAVERELGQLPVVAEDLGVITEPVVRLRRELGFPGMVVLQFAAAATRRTRTCRQNHEADAVVYTGTHDNDTTLGWWRVAVARGARGGPRSTPPTRRGRSSTRPGRRGRRSRSRRCRTCSASAHDARMNLPGTDEGNWRWRYAPGELTPELAARLRGLTERTERVRT